MRKSQLVLGIIFAGIVASSALAWASPRDVVATVGSETITVQDLQDRINSFPPQYAQELQKKEAKAKVLDQMVSEKLLLVAAKKQGIHNTSAYKAQIKASQDQLLISTYLRDNIDQKVTVTEEDAHQYYIKNPQQFQELEERRASHILVKTEDEAKDIAKQIQAGADFATVADQKSIDPSAKTNHGDLGYFAKGQMVPEFEQAAFALQKGQVSGIVKTQFGYHVIKLNDVRVRPKLEYTPEVAQQIKEGILGEKKRELTSEQLDKLRKETKIKTDLGKL